MNLARNQMSPAGSQTAALSSSGNTSPQTGVEEWNGTNWSNTSSMNVAHQGAMGAGTTTAAIVAGGGPPAIATTEEWNGTGLYIETLTTTED